MAAQAVETNLLHAVKDELLVRAIYNTPKRIASVSKSGSVNVNTEWEDGKREKWYIDAQKAGGDLIQAGVVKHDSTLIEEGLKALEWGFKKQDRDGSFPGTDDPFHSTSLFVEGASRGLLLLKEYDSDTYGRQIKRYTPRILAAARWLNLPEVMQKGKRYNQKYTHRRYILASALGAAAELTGNNELFEASKAYAEEGIELQQSDGVNPEKGGYDVSYQCLGILEAERFYHSTSDESLKSKLKTMIERGLKWELSKIDANGNLEVEGSTRTEKEAAHTGKIKKPDYKSIIQAFVLGAEITGDRAFHEAAQKIAAAQSLI